MMDDALSQTRLEVLEVPLCVLFSKTHPFVKEERVLLTCVGSPVLPNLSLIISKAKAVI